MLQLKPYKRSGSRRLGTKKPIQPIFSIGKACIKSGPSHFSGCGFSIWSVYGRWFYAFPFRPVPLCSVILLLPLFVDNIIISFYINWNCVVILVIVSFIIDLLDLHFQIFGGRDRMVVGFTTTYAISAYHHWCCEFKSRSRRGV